MAVAAFHFSEAVRQDTGFSLKCPGKSTTCSIHFGRWRQLPKWGTVQVALEATGLAAADYLLVGDQLETDISMGM